jgi:hypothetical protein
MATRTFLRQAKRWVAVAAGVAVLAAAAATAAEAQQASGPLMVSLTVVRSCTLGDVNAVPLVPGGPATTDNPAAASGVPATTPTYGVRCGKQSLAAPATPGSQASAVSKGAPLSVTKTADGRVFVVQF